MAENPYKICPECAESSRNPGEPRRECSGYKSCAGAIAVWQEGRDSAALKWRPIPDEPPGDGVYLFWHRMARNLIQPPPEAGAVSNRSVYFPTRTGSQNGYGGGCDGKCTWTWGYAKELTTHIAGPIEPPVDE